MERKPKRKTKFRAPKKLPVFKSASMQSLEYFRQMARPGNKNKERFKTPEQRLELFDAVCLHLEKGLSRSTFPLCDWDTVERYASVYACEVPPDIMREAVRRGQLWWEELGRIGTMGGKVNGERINFNAQSWAFNMKNRLGWKDSMNVINTIEGGVLMIPEPLTAEQFKVYCLEAQQKQAAMNAGGITIDGTATTL